METFRNQSFQARSFILEQVAFVKCKLTDCDLYYSGGDFDWAETAFENCRFHWQGAAKNTVALLQTMGMIQMPIPAQSLAAPGQKPN